MDTKLMEILNALIPGCAKGAYQRNLLAGGQIWRGADLAGTAQKYGGSYAESRHSLVARIDAAIAPHGASARVRLCLYGPDKKRRWHRRLVITCQGKHYLWQGEIGREIAAADCGIIETEKKEN